MIKKKNKKQRKYNILIENYIYTVITFLEKKLNTQYLNILKYLPINNTIVDMLYQYTIS